MNGWRIARYDKDGKLIGLSKWAKEQTDLAGTFDIWTRGYNWNCAMIRDDQLDEVVNGKR